MKPFDNLYQKTVDAAVHGDIASLFKNAAQTHEFDSHQLDCLLNPKKHAPVFALGKCDCEKADCVGVCFYNAISRGEDGMLTISEHDCVGCGECIVACEDNNLTDIKEVVPLFESINNGETVYALIAPAYISQFSAHMTPGKLRSAFKKLGFAGMIEVALFADILTLKEALEFDRAVTDEKDYLLTSCCCPMWVAMIRKVYSTLIPHMPPSVSPMIACGRSIKKMHPHAKTVFIGPCIAKKAEARQEDIADAVDYVLTFQEMRDIFDAACIDPHELDEDLRDHSSKAGRIYARTGGVSEAVQVTVQRLMPGREIPLKAKQGDGVPECKAMLGAIQNDEISANFLEGMGCVGGCVGGPKALIDYNEGRDNVNEYGEQAASLTPADNPYVLELLTRLGFDTIESLAQGSNMFTRDFGE